MLLSSTSSFGQGGWGERRGRGSPRGRPRRHPLSHGFYLYSLTNGIQKRLAVLWSLSKAWHWTLQRYCTWRDCVWMWPSVLLRTQAPSRALQGPRGLPSPAQPTTTLGRCVSELELCGDAAEQSGSVAGCSLPRRVIDNGNGGGHWPRMAGGRGFRLPGTNGISTLALQGLIGFC